MIDIKVSKNLRAKRRHTIINVDDHEYIKKLAEEHSCNRQVMLEFMIDYFRTEHEKPEVAKQ